MKMTYYALNLKSIFGRYMGAIMKKNKGVWKAFTMVSQIGISMMVPIFMCLFIGVRLDDWLDTSFLMPVFLVLGILTAFRNIYHLTRNFYEKDKAKEDAQLKYYEDMKKERESHKK